MYKEIRISNEELTAVICTQGAELKSIMKQGKELLWDGDPDVWSGQAPVLFPICGGLKDGKFTYNNKDYYLPKHGYAMHSEFEIEKSDNTSAVFLLRSNSETLKQYPFEYELRITYRLDGSTLNVDYSVINIGSNTMYYSIGAHEAYSCPEGVENYSILFEKNETLDRAVITDGLLDHATTPVIENSRELLLKNENFIKDAFVFLDIKSNKVALKNNSTGECINVEFGDFDYLLLWTIPGAKFLCIEPWCGLPDYIDGNYDISCKKGIISLDKGKECIRRHSITF